MKGIRIAVLTIALSMFTTVAWGQGIPLSRRSSFELSVGVWTGRRMIGMATSINPDRAKEFGNTFSARIGYVHALGRRLDLAVSIGLLTGHSTNLVDPLGVSPTVRQTGLVSPILIGIRYYFPDLKTIRRITPYLSAALGLDMGYETGRQLYDAYRGSQIFEFAPAARLGAGAAYRVDSHIRLLFRLNYYLMTGFPYAVGGSTVFNGLGLSLGSDLMF